MSREVRGVIYYGWIVVGITFATALVAAGSRAAPVVFIHPLEAEFGWNRAALAGAISINLLLYGLAAPVSGRLIDRFGPRVVMGAGLVMLSIGLAGTAAVNQLWQLNVLWGVVVGLSAGASGTVVYASVAGRWFVARRGLVLGIMGSAVSTGQLVFLPLLMAVVVHFGWRVGSLTMAAIVLLMLVPVVLWMRNDPSEVGLAPYGGAAGSGARGGQLDEPPVPMVQAVRDPMFWLLAGSFFVCGATSGGLVGTHFIPHSLDHQIPEVMAAATLGLMGGMNFVGTMLSGWLTDKVDPRKLLSLVYALRGGSLFVLPFVLDFPGLFIFAVFYGLDWFATVPPTVALVTARFGKRSVATMYGWIFLSHQVGAAMAATATGAVRVWLGDYQVAFLAGGVFAMIAAAMALMMRAERAVPVPAPDGTPAS